MGKLLRSLRAENMRLYSGLGAVLTVTAVFILSLFLAIALTDGSGENGLLPSGLSDMINSPAVVVPEEEITEEPKQVDIQPVISDSDISNSDISGSDILSESDTPAPPVQPADVRDWHDSYRARYEELIVLNDEYAALTKTSTGMEKAYYIAEQQKCVREGLIINHCLSSDSPAGHSRPWNIVFVTIWLMLLPIGILAAAVMASKTAGEMKSGVITTLYTLPATRLKQYTAKYLSAGIFALLLCGAAWTGAVFGAVIGCGGMGEETECIKVLGETVSTVSCLSYSVELSLSVLAGALVATAFSAAIATTTRSQSAATVLSAVLLAAAMVLGRAAGASGNIVMGLSPVSVLDISAPLRGIPNYASAGYVVSWLCAAVYWLVFIIIGYLGIRRDVK